MEMKMDEIGMFHILNSMPTSGQANVKIQMSSFDMLRMRSW
jgi:hypothetical protein